MAKGRLYQAFCKAGFEREARILATTKNGIREMGLGRKILIYDSWRFGEGTKFNGYQTLCQISDFIKTKTKNALGKINPTIDSPEDIVKLFVDKYAPTQI